MANIDQAGPLRTDDGFNGRADDFYAALLAAHDTLPERASHALNARLVLLLANHIGDIDVLQAALDRARRDLERVAVTCDRDTSSSN